MMTLLSSCGHIIRLLRLGMLRPTALYLFAASAAALTAPRSTTFELPLRPGRSGQSLWDSPLSAKDALGADVPMLSSERVVTADGSEFYVDVYPQGLTCPGRAAVFLRYVPAAPGDEVDATFSLSLVRGGELVATSAGCGGAAAGGSPAWRGAMTFCSAREAVESCGRAADWGAHAWPELAALRPGEPEGAARVVVAGEIAVWATRRGESSGALKGALRAALGDATRAARGAFRSGEVVVPVAGSDAAERALRDRGLASGGEYRVMELASAGARAFRARADDDVRLTLRPAVDIFADASGAAATVAWPVNVTTRELSADIAWRNRYDARAFGARASFDLRQNPLVGGSVAKAVALASFWLASALAPIPLVLFARSFASVYVIPSESMVPALQKNDVLLVDKVGLQRAPMPNVGDVVVFNQPPALRALVGDSVSKSSQFVKRVVALPGDAVSFEDRSAAGAGALPLCAEPKPALAKALASAAKEREGARVAKDSVFVRGDCDGVSVDSRIWGDLDRKYLVGKPTYRIWPPSRVGPL